MYRKIIILGLLLLPFQMLLARTQGTEIGPQGLVVIFVVGIGAILICLLSNFITKISQQMHWFLRFVLMIGDVILTILILWGIFTLLISAFEYIPQKWLMLFE